MIFYIFCFLYIFIVKLKAAFDIYTTNQFPSSIMKKSCFVCKLLIRPDSDKSIKKGRKIPEEQSNY